MIWRVCVLKKGQLMMINKNKVLTDKLTIDRGMFSFFGAIKIDEFVDLMSF